MLTRYLKDNKLFRSRNACCPLKISQPLNYKSKRGGGEMVKYFRNWLQRKLHWHLRRRYHRKSKLELMAFGDFGQKHLPFGGIWVHLREFLLHHPRKLLRRRHLVFPLRNFVEFVAWISFRKLAANQLDCPREAGAGLVHVQAVDLELKSFVKKYLRTF